MRLAASLATAAYALSSLAGVLASAVIDLDTANFGEYVGGDKPALVEFYAPWCGHCKNLAPTYDKLAEAFPSGKVVIAKTDADGVGRELGTKYGVTGFPTLKWFPAGSTEAQDYTGGRDLDSLVGFVTQNSGVKSNIKPPPPPAALQLDAGNFDDIALDDNKNVLVSFTAPWCGHCKNMKPAYEEVARAFKSESDCVVANMQADDEVNKPIAARYDVTSFPTIRFFPKGSKEPVPYTFGRTVEAFTQFLNEHCGTHRSSSGLLNDLAGKVAPLDSLASEFFTAKTDREAIIARAQEALSSVNETSRAQASYYVKAMERVVEKGEAWLVKEQGRIANLLASPSLAPTKLDELKIKANILSAFAVKKAEEVVDAATDAAGDAYEAVKEQVGKATDRVKEEL